MKAIFQRELKSYFTSITAYAFAAFLLLFIGIYTMSVCLVAYYPNYEYVLGNTAFIFLLIVPIITMKTFAEERKQKTDQLLYALPIGMPKVVFGKYLALLAVFALPLIPSAVYPLILKMYGSVSLSVVFATFVGFFLLGAALLAVGMFVSSLTESQPLAAGVSFLIILINFLSSSLASYMPIGGELFASLSLFDRLDNFVYGILDMADVVFYLSTVALFLFLTVQSLEKRRWS